MGTWPDGQALEQDPGLPYYLVRNEQRWSTQQPRSPKPATGWRTLVCTTSIGPGATNMVTGAALATIKPFTRPAASGDIFARRDVAPVLQQLESPASQDVSVTTVQTRGAVLDRIERPEQILTALPAALRVLTSPAETGAVMLALPQDVQAEAFDYPEHFFEKRVWPIARARCDRKLLSRRRSGSDPPAALAGAGGGVIYSEASLALAAFAAQTGIPVVETQAGKGALPYDHPRNSAPWGYRNSGRKYSCAGSDLILGVGTRYSDFTTCSQSAFQTQQFDS